MIHIRTLHDAQTATRQLRLAAGLTQATVAARLHVVPGTVANWENHHYGPTVGALADFAPAVDHQLILAPALPGQDGCCHHCRRVTQLVDAREPIRRHQGLGSPFALLYDAVAIALGRHA